MSDTKREKEIADWLVLILINGTRNIKYCIVLSSNFFRSKLDRNKDRDISEKIALGMPTGANSQETMFDQRLFNKTQVSLFLNLSHSLCCFRVWIQAMVWKMTPTMCMINHGEQLEEQGKLYTGQVRIWTRISMVMMLRNSSILAGKTIRCLHLDYSDLFFRFQPDKEFSGTDRSRVRDGPVQFEKEVDEDLFGLNQFLTEAKKAKRPSDSSR